QGRFIVGLRRRGVMLRYLCRGAVKGLPFGKGERTGEKPAFFAVLRVWFCFEGFPVASFQAFPPVGKYRPCLCGKGLSGTFKNRRDRFKGVRFGGSHKKPCPGK